MPVKRSRVGRSSSFLEIGVVNRVSPPLESSGRRRERRLAPLPPSNVCAGPPSSSAGVSTAAEKSDESPPSLLTVSSPDQQSDNEPIGAFLKKCYYCKKKIREDGEVFMYGYLRAFCTAECRDGQITMDSKAEKVPGNQKKCLLNAK